MRHKGDIVRRETLKRSLNGVSLARQLQPGVSIRDATQNWAKSRLFELDFIHGVYHYDALTIPAESGSLCAPYSGGKKIGHILIQKIAVWINAGFGLHPGSQPADHKKWVNVP
jgi:hypothetical protein